MGCEGAVALDNLLFIRGSSERGSSFTATPARGACQSQLVHMMSLEAKRGRRVAASDGARE